MNLRVLGALFLTMAGAMFWAGGAEAAFDNVPTPNVTGPIVVTADSHPFLSTDIDLSKYGYKEDEYFLAGDAYRYDLTGAFNTSASRIETGGPTSDGKYPFKTRIVVRRPSDPSKANGKVIVEWNNVTSTQDVEFNWFGDPYYLLNHGYTFVGVTAQTTGVASLKTFDPTRYADLTVNGNNTVPTGSGNDADALSFDVFSSVIKALRGDGTGVDPMGGINPDMVIASGESQSCSRLATQYNRIEPLHGIVDAYLLTVCGNSLRTDRPEKAIRVLTETENRTSRPTSTFPDTSSLRQWEVAAASHLPRLAFDNVNPTLTRDFAALTVTCNKFPLSLVQWPYVANRAIDAMVKWVKNGEDPPIAPRGEYVPNPAFTGPPITQSNPEVILARDQDGIAQGAIRFPEVTVPTATNDGINSAAPGGSVFSAFCPLLGSSTQFTSERLHSLYFDYADYITRYATATDAFVNTGFILPEDGVRLKDYSRQFASLRPSEPLLAGSAVNKGTFDLSWQASEAPDTSFDLQRAKTGGSDWADVSATFDGSKASLSKEPQGTHDYRVSSSTVIPANNIAAAYTVTTPYSEEITGVKVDRSGPKAPKIVVKGKRVKGKKGTWKGKVKVKFTGRPDVRLPDGTAGSGLNKKSVPKTRVIRKKGKTVIKVQTKDKLGNRSKTARVVIRIKK